jgi:hypothetical protein
MTDPVPTVPATNPAEAEIVIDTALKVQRLLDVEKKTEDEVAAMFGNTTRWVQEMESFAAIPSKYLDQVRRLKLGYRQHQELAKVTDSLVLDKVMQQLKQGSMSAPKLEALINSYSSPGSNGSTASGASEAVNNAIEPVISPELLRNSARGSSPTASEAVTTPSRSSGSNASSASEAVNNAIEPVISPELLRNPASGSSPTASEAVTTPSRSSGSSASEAARTPKRSSGSSAALLREVPASPYPLLRRMVDLATQIFLFWIKSVQPVVPSKPGDLFDDWCRKGWFRAGLVALEVGLVGYGGWHLEQDIRHFGWHFWKGGLSGTSAMTGFLNPRSSFLPSPHLTATRLVDGNRLELHWDPVAPGCTYRVYARSPEGGGILPVAGDVSTPGATVNYFYSSDRKRVLISVTTLNPNHDESLHSDLIAFDLSPVNNQYSVTALPISGSQVPPSTQESQSKSPGVTSSAHTGGNPKPPPATTFVPKAPEEVHATVKTPDLIHITWRAVGPGMRYNVYSSAARELTALRKENDHLLTYNGVTWTPETGQERYWIVVTAVDAQGHESAYSEAIEVVRHPEKTRNSDLLNDAAGVVKKVLPW